MIPKKIHYCWFGNNPLPKNIKKYIKTWKKKCPDYEIIEWNETNFDISCNEFMKNAYEAKCWAFVSDYARLKIIHDNGGIYLDTDVEVIKSLDTLLTNKCYFGIQQDGQYINTGLGFGAEKGHKIIKEMLNVYDKTRFDKSKLTDIACPIINTNVLKKYGYKFNNEIQTLKNANVTIYPPKYFDPLAPGQMNDLTCDDTYSIHQYNASWTSKKQQLKRKICTLIGQKNIIKIKKIIKR